MIAEKMLYAELCATAEVPIFMQNWWLDAVCTEGSSDFGFRVSDVGTDKTEIRNPKSEIKGWSVVMSFNEQREIEAALTFATRQKFGFRTLSEPVLTPFCGVWFRQKTFKRQHEAIFYEKKHLQKLIEQLPSAHRYSFRLHVSLKDWQPFFWAGWQQETRYTYRLNIENLVTVFDNFNDNTKRNIRKSTQNFTIEKGDNFDKFLEINGLTYQRQQIKNPIPAQTWQAVEQILSEKKARTIFFAKNTEGAAEVGFEMLEKGGQHTENRKPKTEIINAAIYVVFDKSTAYYLAGGSTKLGRSKGAMHGLLWQAIQEAAARGCTIFDFEGSMLQGVEPFFRGFGGDLMSYFRVFKYGNRFLKHLFQ